MWPKKVPASIRARPSALSAAACSGPTVREAASASAPRSTSARKYSVPAADVYACPRRSTSANPACREQRRDPAHQPRVVDEHVEHRLGAALQRVAAVERERHRRVVAVEHREPAARSQHAVRLGQRTLALGDVAQRRVEDDHVEARIVERRGRGRRRRRSRSRRRPRARAPARRTAAKGRRRSHASRPAASPGGGTPRRCRSRPPARSPRGCQPRRRSPRASRAVAGRRRGARARRRGAAAARRRPRRSSRRRPAWLHLLCLQEDAPRPLCIPAYGSSRWLSPNSCQRYRSATAAA